MQNPKEKEKMQYEHFFPYNSFHFNPSLPLHTPKLKFFLERCLLG